MNRKEAIKKWEEIVQEMEAKKSELDTLLGAARQSNEHTASALNDARNKLNEVVSIESQANQKLQTIEQSRVNAAEKEEESKNKLEAISQIHSEAESKKSEIETLKSEVNDLATRSKSLTTEIENQLGFAVAGTLAHTFNDRKKELQISMQKWFKWLLLDIIALVGVAIFVFLELKSNLALTPNFFLKFTLSFPFIYAVFFFHSQYDKDKKLLEEYAFKSAVSLSLEAYRKLLKEEIGDDKNKLLEFIVGSINRIYTSPRESISIHPDKDDNIQLGILKEVADILKKFTK